MAMHHEPATSIIGILGGVTATAEMAGVSVHTVVKWRLSRDKGGTGGVIPHWHHRKLLEGAAAREKNLRPEDFVQREVA